MIPDYYDHDFQPVSSCHQGDSSTTLSKHLPLLDSCLLTPYGSCVNLPVDTLRLGPTLHLAVQLGIWGRVDKLLCRPYPGRYQRYRRRMGDYLKILGK